VPTATRVHGIVVVSIPTEDGCLDLTVTYAMESIDSEVEIDGRVVYDSDPGLNIWGLMFDPAVLERIKAACVAREQLKADRMAGKPPAAMEQYPRPAGVWATHRNDDHTRPDPDPELTAERALKVQPACWLGCRGPGLESCGPYCEGHKSEEKT